MRNRVSGLIATLAVVFLLPATELRVGLSDLEAANAEEATRISEDEGQNVDLIVTDVVMLKSLAGSKIDFLQAVFP